MTQSTELIPARPRWMLVIRWSVVILFFAVLLSWGISFWKPHRVMMAQTRKYQVVMDRGTVQFWVTVRTEAITTDQGRVVKEAGFRRTTDGTPVVGKVPSLAPQVHLSPWRAYSTATIAIGQEIPQITSGNLSNLFAGERTSIHGVAHWLVAAVLFFPAGWVLLDLRHWRTRRRAAAGQCLNCGYDLRATPDRCPECGHFADKGSGKAFT